LRSSSRRAKLMLFAEGFQTSGRHLSRSLPGRNINDTPGLLLGKMLHRYSVRLRILFVIHEIPDTPLGVCGRHHSGSPNSSCDVGRCQQHQLLGLDWPPPWIRAPSPHPPAPTLAVLKLAAGLLLDSGRPPRRIRTPSLDPLLYGCKV